MITHQPYPSDISEAKKGFVLLSRHWVVERSFGWMARFRRLACDYEHLGEPLKGMHYVAFSLLMLHKAPPVLLELMTRYRGLRSRSIKQRIALDMQRDQQAPDREQTTKALHQARSGTKKRDFSLNTTTDLT